MVNDELCVKEPGRFALIPHDRFLGWTPYFWLAYFPTLFISPVIGHASRTIWTATIVSGVVFLLLYFRAYWTRVSLEFYVIVAIITAMGIALVPVNQSGAVFTIYAGAFAGTIRPLRRSIVALGIICLASLIEPIVLHTEWSVCFWQIFMTIVVGGANTHFSKVREMVADLHHAHEEIEQLATLAERERIARDLHDVLGHTLSLITLKAALASRIIDRDPVRAAAEIRDVETASRDALAEVRAAVTGYRDVGLAKEVVHAHAMLEAAGITIRDEMDSVVLAPAEEAALALALREAVTNVVRHSGATRCKITLRATEDGRILSVEDDGNGKHASDGNGLRGMKERMDALGGSVALDTSRGTTLRAKLPREPRLISRSSAAAVA